MSACHHLVEFGRRQFLRGGVGGAAPAQAAPPLARVSYPSSRLANEKDLAVDQPLDIAYPDDESPGVLLKLGRPVPGGVGPEGDIVAFSTLCPHKGFPLAYVAADRTLSCPGHYSRFDCEQGGQQVWGRRRRTCRSSGCASTRRARSMPKVSTS